MKKVFLILSAVVFLVSGCSFDVHMVTPAPASVEATPAPVTPITFPSPEPVSASTEVPNIGYTPDPNASLFYGAHAVLDPVDTTGRFSFPAGTKRIYVVWHYQNMRAGMTVKREWYLDGTLWLMREEAWDIAKYGASGIMQDVSIFDENVGLPSGVFQLQIFIDGVQQPIGADTMFGPEGWLNFQILPDGSITEAASPDFQWSAAVINGNRLVLRDKNGSPTDLFTSSEIPNFLWFPDSRHILFIERDRSGQSSGTNRGIRDRLWMVDIVRMEIVTLYASESALGLTGGMTISPDGRFIAISEGSSDGDACFVDLKWVFLEMGANFASVRVLRQDQFTGLPDHPDSTVYPAAAGTWENDTQFVAPMKVTCVTDNSLAGEYVLDVVKQKAAKK